MIGGLADNNHNEKAAPVPSGNPHTVVVKPSAFIAGEVPAVAAVNDRVFIVNVAQDGEKQSVWLVDC
jgi:hypothetical protein